MHAEAAFGSGRTRLLGQVPEKVLDRGQYICNQAHLIYAFDDEYKLHQVAFDVSQQSFFGPYVHVFFPFGGANHTRFRNLRNMSVGVYKVTLNDLICTG